jgi:hypothetical protein
MTDQLELFAQVGTLTATTLRQRHAGALAVLEEGDLDAAERLDLLLLVVAPAAVAEIER